MEQALDKKGGRQYGPPGRKRLIFFLDDINMPTPDKYGTQDSLAPGPPKCLVSNVFPLFGFPALFHRVLF